MMIWRRLTDGIPFDSLRGRLLFRIGFDKLVNHGWTWMR